jgi:UDP-N-acetylmuramate--alanine ligase
MNIDLSIVKQPFFIGVAGAGMSAIAQYLQGTGMQVSGSDRFFAAGTANDVQQKLEQEGIHCFVQDGSGITGNTDLVVVSTAVEDTVAEVQKAKELNIPIIKRSELLALIAATKKTIAIGGTSGKSTTSAMLFDVLEAAGLGPGIISGAGLVSLIKQGKIGNARVGKGDWLVIEADESDGSIVQYKPAIGVLLNVDKDHKEISVLMDVFNTFKENSATFIVNRGNIYAKTLSLAAKNDFTAVEGEEAGYVAADYEQEGFVSRFTVNAHPFELQIAGKHNMENALAAVAVAGHIGVSLDIAAQALGRYEGIYRRNQVLGKKGGVWVVDDFAHNPVKCAAAIASCQPVASRVIAWFQPHGYGPTRFLRNDFVAEISKVLRPQDEIWMSEIFYAGGTATKDISAADLINDIAANGKQAYFVEDRNNLLQQLRSHFTDDCVLLLMGARDPSLEVFAKEIWQQL